MIQKRTTTNNTASTCNCRNKQNCPLQGQCLAECVVYKATITAPSLPAEHYLGSTEGPFKTRYNNHTYSFRNTNKEHATSLSTRIHQLNRNNIQPRIHWSIVKQCRPYKCGSRRCDLCLTEKLHILQNKNTINKRTELLAKCRHSTKFKLKSA